MILSGFKRKSIQRRIDKKLSKSINNCVNSTGKIGSILVFANESTGENIDKIVASELIIDISKIKVLIFKSKIDKTTIIENEISEKDFGWFGSIKTSRIVTLINTEFDLLLNYSDNNLFLNSLSFESKAKFKVGFAISDKRLYDLMIADKENNISVFNSELKKYLKILNKI